MQVGIFARTFARKSLDDVCAAVRAYDISLVQFNLSCVGFDSLPKVIPDKLPRQIRRCAVAHGITLAAVSGTFNAIHPDPATRADGVRRCQQLIRAAPEMEIPLVTLCTGTRDAENMWRGHPENKSDSAWADLLKTLEQLLAVAEEANVDLGIEPETSNVVDSAPAARQLLDELQSDRIKIVFDAANLFGLREDEARMTEVLAEAVDLLADRISIVHAKEIPHLKDNPQAAGTGRLDWRLYFESLHRIDFTGPVILHNLHESQVDKSVKFVREEMARCHRPERLSR